MTEDWKDITGWEGLYQVSSLGRVRSVRHDCVMSLQLHAKGYMQVHFKRGTGTRVKKFVHRLVAAAFLPNLEEWPMVDHQDTDRSNNAVGNLKWCSYSTNNWYRHRPELREDLNADMAF